MGRYVILRHECPAEYKPGVHWDLMLEAGDALRTWALAVEPAPGIVIAANELPDHRLEYLDNEGPISGDRGTVYRWDAGRFELLSESPRELLVQFAGVRLSANASLMRAAENSKSWEILFGEIPSQKPAAR
jgi:DNA polymerase Ligase (LigD)